MKLRPMIEYLSNHSNCPLIGCEVGVWYGDNAFSILANLDMKMLNLVDPYKAYRIYTGRLFRQSRMDDIKRKCKKNLYMYRDNYVLVPLSSKNASKLYGDNHFVFVYLDGRHTYRYIKQDIKLWYPKVKRGGVFGGHDYNPGVTDGVVRAVDDFVDKYNFKLFQEDLDWWIVKDV